MHTTRTFRRDNTIVDIAVYGLGYAAFIAMGALVGLAIVGPAYVVIGLLS